MNLNNIQTVVLESSQKKSNTIRDNYSEWRSTFKEPILVEEGDTLSIKQALINSDDGATNIILDSDVEVSIQVGFYQTIPNQKDFTTGGNFQASLFRQVSQYGTDPYYMPNPVINMFDAQDNYNWARDPDLTLANKYFVLYNRKDATQNGGNGATADFLRIKPYDPENDETTGCVKQTFTTTIKAGSYSPDQIATILTDRMTQSNKFYYTKTGAIDFDGFMCSIDRETIRPSVRIGGGDNDGNQYIASYRFQYNGNAPSYQCLIGALQSQLKYENNRFSFALHTPLFEDQAGSNTPIVIQSHKAKGADPANDGSYLETYIQSTGCFITKLQPESFWDSLGFTQEYCQSNVYPPNINESGVKISHIDFEKYITGQFFGNEDIMSSASENPVIVYRSEQIDKYSSQQPSYLLAGTDFVNDNSGGYYLLEADCGLINNKYYDVSNHKSTVASIASKNYSQESYITVYNESSIQYIHTGLPRHITNITCRIINPLTGDSSQGLGNDSTIFLQIEKASPNVMDFKTQDKSKKKFGKLQLKK